jgi:hypothetical protein
MPSISIEKFNALRDNPSFVAAQQLTNVWGAELRGGDAPFDPAATVSYRVEQHVIGLREKAVTAGITPHFPTREEASERIEGEYYQNWAPEPIREGEEPKAIIAINWRDSKPIIRDAVVEAMVATQQFAGAYDEFSTLTLQMGALFDIGHIERGYDDFPTQILIAGVRIPERYQTNTEENARHIYQTQLPADAFFAQLQEAIQEYREEKIASIPKNSRHFDYRKLQIEAMFRFNIDPVIQGLQQLTTNPPYSRFNLHLRNTFAGYKITQVEHIIDESIFTPQP